MPKLSKAFSALGANLGRQNNILEPQKPIRFHLCREYLDSQGYDEGGAYWGHGDPLYYAYTEFCDNDMLVRAPSRDAAKFHVIQKFPLATFYK
jgi:hypothetical protein